MVIKYSNFNLLSFCFYFTDGGDLLLVSCSQDSFIRIWRISLSLKYPESNSDVLQDEFKELKLTSNVFSVINEGTETFVFPLQNCCSLK